jgi:DNA replicative helicase MCM subunit Mcm2 (Cdc46/Mcm family)
VLNMLRLSQRVEDLEKLVEDLKELFEQHTEDCMTATRDLIRRFDQHDTQVKRLHDENKSATQAVASAVSRLEGSTTTFESMLPAIKTGIEETARLSYRRKMLRRVAATVLATLVTVSGLIPLAQLLVGLHVSFRFTGG